VSGSKDKKLIKKQTYTKSETCKLYSRVFWIFLTNFVKIDAYNFELYHFKVGAFFLRQCSTSATDEQHAWCITSTCHKAHTHTWWHLMINFRLSKLLLKQSVTSTLSLQLRCCFSNLERSFLNPTAKHEISHDDVQLIVQLQLSVVLTTSADGAYVPSRLPKPHFQTVEKEVVWGENG